MVFFVLSGYFITSSVMKSIQQGTWSWTDYLIKRVVRLWIVLIPTLLLTYFWAKLQIHFFGGDEYFTGVLDAKTFIGNLFFLQDITVLQFGLNGPLWSLTYEFWYYILFPCLVLGLYSKSHFKKLGYGILFIGISCFVGKQIMLYFLIWLLGALIAVIKPVTFKRLSMNLFVLFFALLAAAASTKFLYQFYPGKTNWMNPNFLPDLSVGLAFTFLIYWIIALFRDHKPLINKNIPKKLAGFSYTLYLVHYPLLYVWEAWTDSPLWNIPHPYYRPIFAVFLGLVMLYAFVLAQLTEEKTPAVTKKILQWKTTFSRKSKI